MMDGRSAAHTILRPIHLHCLEERVRSMHRLTVHNAVPDLALVLIAVKVGG